MAFRTLHPTCFAIAVLIAGCNARTTPDPGGTAGGGDTFPFDFAVTDIAGKQHELSDYLGKVVVVDIWATWCPPCRMEIPSFVKLQETFGPQGFQMIGLNYERVQGAAAVKKVTSFVRQNGINYPCAIGTPEIRAQVPNFQGFPTTIFIGKKGKVRVKAVGLHEYEYLESIVKELLSE